MVCVSCQICKGLSMGPSSAHIKAVWQLTAEISKGVEELLWGSSLCVLKISVLFVAKPLRCESCCIDDAQTTLAAAAVDC